MAMSGLAEGQTANSIVTLLSGFAGMKAAKNQLLARNLTAKWEFHSHIRLKVMWQSVSLLSAPRGFRFCSWVGRVTLASYK